MCRVKIYLLCALFSLPTFFAYSQGKNEDDLKKQASRAFDDEDYATAYKCYSTLLANYPKDPDYNYRLGVAALYTETDKKKALQYLTFASKQKDVEKDVFFFLGKAYHLNYQFDEAIKWYNQYKQVGASSMQKKLQVDRQIECCKNAKRLLSNLQELVILDKKTLNQADYFRSYDLKDIRGKLLVKPSDFTSPNDKKKKDRSIIYLPPSKDQVYYSSYGEGDNKDIYIVRRMPDGNWGKPEPLPGAVNTTYDEDYPFLHPNGMVLYFASKGHNSMGGYDVFKSEYDESSRRWKAPVNLDFPINSPSDDYLFVTDSLEKIAYLASTRQTAVGKVDVFKILTERRAAEFAFIKGTVIKKNPNQNLQSKIKVKNIETGEDAGTFVAEANGEYNIKLSNGGKFIFTVETPGLPTQSEGVNMPTSYSYKPYRQTIDYDNQKLVITNFFETNDNDDNNYANYLALIEEKAKMNVNASDFDINPDNPLANSGNNAANNSGNNAANNSANNAANNSGNNTENNGGNTNTANENNTQANNTGNANTGNNTGGNKGNQNNVSNKQLIDIAYSDAKEMQQEANELKKDATSAFTAANSKQDQANEKKQEYQDLQNKVNTESDPNKKQELTTQAENVKDEADLYAKQAKTANTIAQQLEVDANNKQKEADLNLQYAKALEEADKTKNNKDAIAKLENLQKQLEELSKQKSGSNALVESIKADAQNKQQELANAEKKQEQINKDEADLKKQLSDLDVEIEKTKDKNLLENLNAQKEEVKSDLSDKQKESVANQNKITQLKEEADALKSEADYAANIASGNTTDVATTTTNTVVTNNTANTNTVSTTANTNTISATNTNATSNAYQEKTKQYDEQLTTLNNSDNSLENNKKKSDVLKEYVQTADGQLKQKKQELAKAKKADEKMKLNAEIKELTAKKSDLQQQLTSVNNQIKEQEKQAIAANNNAATTNTVTTNNATNTNSVTANNTTVNTNSVTTNNTTAANTNSVAANNNTTGADTSQTKLIIDRDDPRMQNTNTLLTQSQSNLTEEKKLFSNFEYTDPKAMSLKKEADDKLDQLNKNNAQLVNQLGQIKTDIAKENAGSNDQKIAELNKMGDDLNNQAFQLRKQAKTLSGTEKQNALSKILSLEKQAAGFKYQAARLQYQSDDNNYATNKQAIDEMVNQNLAGADVMQAKEISLEADKFKKEAIRLREEAEAQGDVQAKIGALSNADEKEKEALKKQQEALALLNKGNATVATTTTKEKQLDDIKLKLSKEMQASVNALKVLTDANKAEYNAALSQVNAQEKKSGAKSDATDLKTKAQETFKKASDDYTKLATIQDEEQKRDYLLALNIKMEESITQLRQAKQVLNGESIASNTTNTANTNSLTTTNTSENISNTNIANTSTVSSTATTTAKTNTTSANETPTNTLTANNSANTSTLTSGNENSTTAITNTTSAGTNTMTATSNNQTTTTVTTNLNAKQAEQLKTTPDYQKYIGYQSDVNKYNEAANKDEAAAKDYRSKAETMASIADALPESEKKTQKQNEANAYKAKADSLQTSANNNRSIAESKKQEQDTFVKSLDAKTANDIAAVASNTSTTTTNAPTKYSNYSENFRNSANQKDEQLTTLKSQGNDPENLKQQNTALTAYMQDIDKEIAAKKKDQLAAKSPADKLKISQQIKNLQTRKTELTNEKNANDNALRLASANTNANNNTAANNNTGNETNANNNVTANNNAGNENNANNSTTGNNNVANTTSNENAANNNTSENNAANNTNANNTAGNTTNTTGNNTANNNAANTNSTSASTTVNVPVNGFEIRKTNAYSAANPIPLNEKLADGLVFRVQIGAFKTPIAPDKFAGLAPIGAESTNFGFTRYQVGMFTDYQQANAVRNDMRKLKYNDAFVVAYRNGKRISLTEALDSLVRIGVDVTSRTNTTAGITENSNIPVNPEANANVNTNVAPAIINGELNKSEGLVFTVQVGVYTENVSADKLMNLKPIFKEVLPNGYVRYTAGIYGNLDKVKADRARVNELGIRDAFVSAYMNGQRVKIQEAIDKLNAGGVKLPADDPIVFPNGIPAPVANENNAPPVTTNTTATVTTTQTTAVQPFSNGVTEGPTPTPENGVKTTEEGVTFKVQIGAYRKQVPQAVANAWLRVKTWPIKYTLINDLYIYTIGSFTEAKFAEQLKREIVALGITDAFIVVYKDGQKLSFAEGAQYIKR